MASQQLEALIQMLRSGPLSEELSIEEARAALDALAAQFQLPKDVRSESVHASTVPAEWVSTPESKDERVIYHLHGGGYALGSPSTERALVSLLCRAAAARALVIDYRLAPENSFPAAVEDSTAAYRWLLSKGADPARTVIAGASAGGGLTVATLVALRDEGQPLPAAAVCLSPWVDMEALGESMVTKAKADPTVTREGLLKMAKAYLGDADPRTPLAAPLYANLRGLPPLLIQVGGAEALLDDAVRLAERAKAAGVDVILEPWDDMIHVWQAFAYMLPEGQQAIDRIGEFIRLHTD
jgi:acetyl esterase/lipase